MKGVRPVKIPELLRDDRITFSLEIFPPKKAINKNKLYNIVRELKPLEPDYISVTHGAGGKEKDAFTCEIASTIKKWYDIETMAHLTCVNAGREQIELAIDDLKESGIKNVLALRGDIDPEKGNTGDYEHANELVSIIKEKGGLNILGACYPEGHYESPDLETDIEHLKYKIDAGVEVLITQLFYDNELRLASDSEPFACQMYFLVKILGILRIRLGGPISAELALWEKQILVQRLELWREHIEDVLRRGLNPG